MGHIKPTRRYLINTGCTDKECPFWSTCRKLPTEVHTVDEETDTGIDILFTGQGGGKTEDERGVPFCGVSGSLLRATIEHIQGIYPFTFALTNIVRACPKDETGKDRPPVPEELDHCLMLLDRDMQRLKPKVIVPLGGSAANCFVKGDSIFDLRGRILESSQGTIIPTLHPASVSRVYSQMSLLYEDICKAVHVAQGRCRIPYGFDQLGESTLLSTVAEVQEFCNYLKHDLTKQDVVSIDTETKNLNKRYGNRLATIQLAPDTKTGYVIPIHHIETPFSPTELKQVTNLLKDLFTNPVSFKYWLMHNAVYDQGRIKNELGFWVKSAPVICTMVGYFLLDENRWKAIPKGKDDRGGAYKLKMLCREVFGFDYYDKGILASRAEGSLADLPLTGSSADSLVGYAGMDAYCTNRLFRCEEQLASLQDYYDKWINLLTGLYDPVYRMIASMELNGFKIDLKFLRALKGPNSPILGKMEDIREELKTSVNAQKANELVVGKRSMGQSTLFMPWVLDFDSRDCLITLFRDVMQLEAEEKKTGPSYDTNWYEALTGQYREVDLYASYQGLKKLSTGYINQIEGYIEPSHGYEDCKDGRIRGSFWLTGTVTGRTSSSSPNLQNVPRSDDDEKKLIKDLFIAEPGHMLIQLDAKTSEVRWWDLLSRDPELAKGFNEAKKYTDLYRNDPNPEYEKLATLYGDFHKVTASLMFQVPIEKVEKWMRQTTKTIVFGLIYGRGVPSIAAQLNKDIKEVQKLVDQFFARFPVGVQWLESMVDIGKKQLYIESPIGRRRRLPFFLVDKDKDRSSVQNHTRNQAMNSPVQGISSDVMLLMGAGMLTDYIEDNNKPWRCMNIVHDSNVIEAPFDDVVECVYTAEEIYTTKLMEQVTNLFGFEFTIPLEVDFELSAGPKNSWGSLKKWDGTPKHLDELVERGKQE